LKDRNFNYRSIIPPVCGEWEKGEKWPKA